jgi:hypothetical protein
MIVSTTKFLSNDYNINVQQAARNNNFGYLRIKTGDKLFVEELEGLDTQQLFDFWLDHKNNEIGDYANEAEWNELMCEYIQESIELDQLEDERQSI